MLLHGLSRSRTRSLSLSPSLSLFLSLSLALSRSLSRSLSLFLSVDGEYAIDVPAEFASERDYRATLGHKVFSIQYLLFRICSASIQPLSSLYAASILFWLY